MSIVITGGDGFIGRAFGESYTGDAYVYDMARDQFMANGFQLNEFMKRCGPEWVVHLAAIPGVSTGEKTIGSEAFADVANLKNLLRAMQLSGCKKILFLSTGSVYGSHEHRIDETAEIRQQEGYYAAGKLACEAFLGAWQKATPDSTVVILRLGTIIGPGNNKGFIKDFVRKLKADPTKLKILGDGSQVKSYVHIDDLVSAMHLAMTVAGFQVFNVGSDAMNAMSINEALPVVCHEMGCTPSIERGDGAQGFYGDIHVIDLNSAKLRRLGWKPEHSGDDAIRQNVWWLQEHPEVFG